MQNQNGKKKQKAAHKAAFCWFAVKLVDQKLMGKAPVAGFYL